MPNPFTPSFGAIPLFPAGRDMILKEMKDAFSNYAGNPMLTSLLVGPRGSGKTSLLSMISDLSKNEGWITVDTTARPGMLEDIYQNLLIQASDLLERKHIQLTSLQIGSFSFSLDSKDDMQPNWRNRMEIILQQLAEQDIGLLMLIDEVIADEPELIELSSVYQLFKRRFQKVGMIMAGLPANISSLINEKTVTFLRRAHQVYLGRIPDIEIEIAFKKSIEREGRCITPDALSEAVKAIDGFAYMMQLVGYYTWRSTDDPTITLENAQAGINYAKKDLRAGVLDSTYRDLSKNDRLFLFAMLKDEKESALKDIAARMHKTPGYASTYKKRLLIDGIIEENPGKTISIAIPSFRDYLCEMKETEDM